MWILIFHQPGFPWKKGGFLAKFWRRCVVAISAQNDAQQVQTRQATGGVATAERRASESQDIQTFFILGRLHQLKPQNKLYTYPSFDYPLSFDWDLRMFFFANRLLNLSIERLEHPNWSSSASTTESCRNRAGWVNKNVCYTHVNDICRCMHTACAFAFETGFGGHL